MEYVKLEEIIEQIRGVSYKPIDVCDKNNGIPVLTASNIQDDKIILDELIYVNSNKIKSEQILQKNDILICASSGSKSLVGKAGVFDSDARCSFGAFCKVVRLKDKENVVQNYLNCFFRSNIYRTQISEMSQGANINNIKTENIDALKIPLPPKDQQQKIAAHLDKITEAINNKKKQLTLFDELVKSKFVEMFGDPVTNEMEWEKVLLKELAEIKIGPFGSLLHKQDYIENGHCLINPTHITEDKIIKDSTLSVSDKKYKELSQYHLFIDDIVLGRRGEMGRCAVVCEEGLLCGTGSIIIRPNGKMKPYFIQKMISNPVYKDELENKAVGVTMKNLNVSIVENLSFPLPPLHLQNQFADFVQKCDRAKITVRHEIACLQELLDSKMQEYFN